MEINPDIEYEISRGEDIISNCTELLADAYLLGKQPKIIEYTNVLCIIGVSVAYLKYSYIADLSHQRIINAIYIIREFIKYGRIKPTVDYFELFNIETCIGENSTDQITPGGHDPNEPTTDPDDQPIIINPEPDITMDFRKYTIPITSDGQTQFTMPFNISNVDVDYISLRVGGDDPAYTRNGVGYHMEGTTLYWHGDYPLRTEYKAIISYVVN